MPITPTYTEIYLPCPDPKITFLMVSHFDCAKQHALRHLFPLNVDQCTEAPSNLLHANVQSRVPTRAKAKRVRVLKS